jgi:hypothetical protein
MAGTGWLRKLLIATATHLRHGRRRPAIHSLSSIGTARHGWRTSACWSQPFLTGKVEIKVDATPMWETGIRMI